MDPCSDFDILAAALRACRLCRDLPTGALPHEPQPILQGSATARLCIASQAPGTRAHASGVPFHDPSGTRLRAWLDLDEAAFYDAAKVAIVRSEEHTSELQSRQYLVCRLLLEKKN